MDTRDAAPVQTGFPPSWVELIPEIVFCADADGRFTYLGDGWTHVTGVSVGTGLGRSIDDWIHPEDRAGWTVARRNGDRFVRHDLRWMTASGYRWLTLSMRRVNLESVATSPVVGILIDSHDRREALAVSESAQAQAWEAVRSRNGFAAMISQEIRTPMNAIMGLTELVLQAGLTPEQQRMLSMVKTSAYSLMDTINDILELSKIEAGRMSLVRETFKLRDCLDRALTPWLQRAEAKKLAFAWKVDQLLPEVLLGDPSRLRQVIGALAGNAFKFTSQGAITVSATPEVPAESMAPAELAASFQWVKIVVKDTGPGISKEQQEHLLNGFQNANFSTARSYGGAGLGLAMCARLIELLHGKIWCVSELGRGSEFHVLLPFSLPTDADLKVVETEGTLHRSGRSLRVLVAEDNEIHRQMMRALLTMLGHAGTYVQDGAEAVAAWEKGDFEVILMDLEMGAYSGIDAVKAIRERERGTGAHIPIIAVTANVFESDRLECLKAGFDEFSAKPVKLSGLAVLLERVVKDSPRPLAAAAAPLSQPKYFDRAAALSCVEDDEELLHQLVEIFLKRTPELLAQLDTAVANLDAAAMALHAHSLKGSLRALGIKQLETLALRIEQRGRGTSTENILPVLEDLHVALEQLTAELRQELTVGAK